MERDLQIDSVTTIIKKNKTFGPKKKQNTKSDYTYRKPMNKKLFRKTGNYHFPIFKWKITMKNSVILSSIVVGVMREKNFTQHFTISVIIIILRLLMIMWAV